jgi:UDP-N-acetylglucosamine acyltransferase
VGLERRGLSPETRRALKQAYRILFQADEILSRAVGRAEQEVPGIPEVKHLLQFIRSSERGITT